MNESIHDYILNRLSEETPEDDLIYAVCQKTELNWDAAQALVEQIKNEHSVEIEDAHIALKALLSFSLYIVGIIVTLAPIVYLWAMLDLTGTLLAFVGGSQTNPETAFRLLQGRCALLGWFYLPSIFFAMLVGLGIINVNIRYMGGIWQELFRKWKMFE